MGIWVFAIASTVAMLSVTANAQPTINDVVNCASRIGTGFPSAGVAQGALFAIIGTGLGPDQLRQASFPLPTRAVCRGYGDHS